MGAIIIAIITIVLTASIIVYTIKEDKIELTPVIVLLIFASVITYVYGLNNFRDKEIEKYEKGEIVIKQPVYIYTDINGDTLKVEEGTKTLISKKKANIQ